VILKSWSSLAALLWRVLTIRRFHAPHQSHPSVSNLTASRLPRLHAEVCLQNSHAGGRKTVEFRKAGGTDKSVRILIVDDFKDWRRQVLSLFQARPEWQVIAEAADGLQAIQKAEELKPDLIVMDIGLPKLNGIEAARQIQQLSPSSKILFLSQNNDLDVVRAALSTGLGYIQKTDVRSDLLPAIEAALQGRQFVSQRHKRLQACTRPSNETPLPP